MPKQSILRLIKRWKRYQPKDSWSRVPANTRGIYVLYNNSSGDHYDAVYIGVAGLGLTGGGGVRGRLKSHVTRIKKWTHSQIVAEHDIARLDVTMDGLLGVDVGHGVQQLEHDIECLRCGEVPACSDMVFEVATPDEFGYQVGNDALLINRLDVAVDPSRSRRLALSESTSNALFVELTFKGH